MIFSELFLLVVQMILSDSAEQLFVHPQIVVRMIFSDSAEQLFLLPQAQIPVRAVWEQVPANQIQTQILNLKSEIFLILNFKSYKPVVWEKFFPLLDVLGCGHAGNRAKPWTEKKDWYWE